jgi:hypothetical protein
MKIFEFRKSRFFHQSWKNRFLLKTKSPNKKRSADLKSALNFEFNYIPPIIYDFDINVGCEASFKV